MIARSVGIRSLAVALLLSTGLVPPAAAGQGGRAVLERRPEAQGRVRPRRATPLAQAAPVPGGLRIFVVSSSTFLASSEVEAKLRKDADFARLGLEVVQRRDDADLLVEVERVLLTRFRYAVLDARTGAVIARGEVSSLFGTASGRIAKRVLKAAARY